MKKYEVNSTLIEVDWNDFEDIKSLFYLVKNRYIELTPNRTTRKEKEKLILDACFRIWETDISYLYEDLNLDTRPLYYVYCHCNPLKPLIPKRGKPAFAGALGLISTPFYVGKGINDRAYNLNRSETHRKVKQKIIERGSEPEVKIIKQGLTELDAYCYESKLFDIFGLISNKGWLTNLDEGHSKEDRQYKYYGDYKLLCPDAVTNRDIE